MQTLSLFNDLPPVMPPPHFINVGDCRVAEVELVYKTRGEVTEKPKITNSRDSSLIFQRVWRKDTMGHRESVWLMLINRMNRVIAVLELATGGQAGAVCDPKLIFQAALKANAAGIILAHNHPSGELIPSQADISLTKKVKEAGRFLEIQLLDHMILTESGKYYSFTDEGML